MVKDGGGIAPDIEILPESLSQITAELYIRNDIFDYVTGYFWAHPGLKAPEQFSFNDQDYADFKTYLLKRNFSYKTVTEESLNELISNAKKEKYYDMHKDLFTDLEKDIAHDLEQDLTVFRNEITELIEDEIIGRYFYEDGAIAWTIKKDEQILKAAEILNNKEEYRSILEGKFGSIIVSGKNDQKIEKSSLPLSKRYQEPV
jgi:carboxyl-terminal processing protease